VSREREGLEVIWIVCFNYVVSLGTFFWVDGWGASQRGTFFGVDVGKKRLVN
jgi:hypothetical protein